MCQCERQSEACGKIPLALTFVNDKLAYTPGVIHTVLPRTVLVQFLTAMTAAVITQTQ